MLSPGNNGFAQYIAYPAHSIVQRIVRQVNMDMACRFRLIARTEEAMAAQVEACRGDSFANLHGGFPSPEPIFIVGMPRAGSTLLEQILASHSDIDGTMELHNILSLASSVGAQYRSR